MAAMPRMPRRFHAPLVSLTFASVGIWAAGCHQPAPDASLTDTALPDATVDRAAPIPEPRDPYDAIAPDSAQCNVDEHPCVEPGGASYCAAIGDPRACGEQCAACEAPDHAIAICSPGGACEFNCRSRYLKVDGGCIDARDN